MSFTLLRSPDDLMVFRKGAEALVQASCVWGPTPSAYPCLITSMRLETGRMVSAYAYPDDVRGLLDVVVPEASKTGPTQSQFNRWLAAQMLTVIHFMTETGICKEAQFEERLLTSLELVDASRAGHATDTALDRLYDANA